MTEPPPMTKEVTLKEDGRTLIYYSFEEPSSEKTEAENAPKNATEEAADV